jgi:peptidoglycan/LPS O-acetylase OafA/YrhL
MIFRFDINGLRAIAVIAVVLFHFNPELMPGGFAGVDVFFVISGFLMTGIIFNGLEDHSFSIIRFYMARANRIIPSLSIVCLILLLFGWFFLPPLEFQALTKHIASSITFSSNIIYWRESGYFDVASNSKWLLHTWSLSAEWQFYLIYPLILIALKRFTSTGNIKHLILLGTIVTFIGCIYATQRWPNMSYYLLPTRAWEMMFGGLAFLYPLKSLHKNSKVIVEYLGMFLILASYIFISKESAWPGYLAFIPVFGAFLILLTNRQDSIITNNRIFQYIGKWSYSIYLWH